MPSSVISSTAVNLSTHTHLTLDASRLIEILQALIANNNAHETQILELQKQVRQLQAHGSGVSAAAAAPPSPLSSSSSAPPPPGGHAGLLLHSSSTMDSPALLAVPSLVAQGSVVTRGGAPTTASSDAMAKEALRQAEQCRRVLGLDTPQGVAAYEQFAKIGDQPYLCDPTAASDCVKALPMLRSLNAGKGTALLGGDHQIRSGDRGSTSALRSDETISFDAYAAMYRGIESKVDTLAASVEALKHQVITSVAASKVSMSNTGKASVAQRSPTPLANQLHPQPLADHVAREDVGHLTHEHMVLKHRVDAMMKLLDQVSDVGPSASANQDPLLPLTGTLSASKAMREWEVRFSNLIKRIEVLEKQKPAHQANDREAAVEAPSSQLSLETRLFDALRAARDSIKLQTQAQLDELRVLIDAGRLSALTAALDDAPYRHESAERPPSALLVSSGMSPIIPKREVLVKAAATNPRRVQGVLAAAFRPTTAGDCAHERHVYRLGTSANFSSPHPVRPQSSLGNTQPNTGGTHTSLPRHHGDVHNAETCVVWQCGWCASTRDQRPTWSTSSPSPSTKVASSSS